MTPAEHIRKLRDACKGLGAHAEGNPAVWTAINDIELDIHDLEKAFAEHIGGNNDGQ
jgi:hypothetical protein